MYFSALHSVRKIIRLNQRDLKNQGGSQSMHNLRADDMNNSRVHEWNRRNEMANQNGGPPGMYHSLQKALDPESTIRGQKIGPRHNQHPHAAEAARKI